MHWLLPSLFSPFFAACVNHIDKRLLTKYFKGGEVGSLVLFSSLISVPIAGAILVFGVDVFSMEYLARFQLITAGVLYMLALLPYFFALYRDETSVVAPLFQMVSPISYIFGALVLGEHVAGDGLLAGALIVGAAIFLSLDLSDKRAIVLKRDVFFLMLLSSTIFALNGVVFKSAALTQQGFFVAAFWNYVGVALFGGVVFCCVPKYRRQFLQVLRQNKLSILSLNATNEACAVAAQLLLHFATMLAPLAMVYWIAEGFQPFFVLLFSFVFFMLSPRRAGYRITTPVLQKIIAVSIMLIGTYLLSF